MNKVILMGRLTRDPEINYSQNGKETAEADSLTIDQVRECLLTLKGFGEKRVSAICDELQRKMSHTSD